MRVKSVRRYTGSVIAEHAQIYCKLIIYYISYYVTHNTITTNFRPQITPNARLPSSQNP
jgi:hypothetical protein